MNNYRLTIGWLYPDLMSTYGDRGNILVLKRRCEWRDIKVDIIPIDQNSSTLRLSSFDLLFGGGAQDKEQDIVMQDLKNKGEKIKERIENNIPALFVCGAPQLMGNYYEPSVGRRIDGLGIFDMTTTHPGPDKPRLIGNVIAKVEWKNLESNVIASGSEAISLKKIASSSFDKLRTPRNDASIVGFENHGGRTHLGENAKPFAKVLKGFGNNGEDGTEGVVYKNAVGCYFHGPLLPKNPQIADFLIAKALEVKYKENVDLTELDDTLELKARSVIAKRLGVTI